MKKSIATRVARLTRRVPGLTNMLRKVLPLSLKRRLGAALLPQTGGGVVEAKDGRKFVMIPDRLFLQVLYDGVFEPSLTNFMTSVVMPDDVAVDVGSNFGWFATHLAMKTSKVICYEPAGRIRKILEQNIVLNQISNVTVRPVAIGDVAGEAVFVIEGNTERESALGYVTNADRVTSGQTAETVEIVCLDDDLAEFENRVSLIKIDCEGFEQKAFMGSTRMLNWQHPPIIITEANSETLTRSGSSRQEMCDYLVRNGYTLFGIRNDGNLYPDNGKAPALACIPGTGKFASRIPVAV